MEGSNLFRRIAGSGTFVGQSLIDSTCKSSTVNELRTVGLEVEQVVVSDTDVLAVVLTTLRGDENGTVGTLITIEGHGCSILQDTDMVDLVGTDEAQIALHTVDENQRCAGAQTLQATYVERGVLLEVSTRSL